MHIALSLGLKATNNNYQQFCIALLDLSAKVWLPVNFKYLHSTE